MKQDKATNTIRNRAVVLLQEVREEHAAFNADLTQRLNDLAEHHTKFGQTFGEHHESLSRYGEGLNEIKEQLTLIKRGQEEQTGLLRDHIQKLDARSVVPTPPSTPEKSVRVSPRAATQQESAMSDIDYKTNKDYKSSDTMDENDGPLLQDWRSLSWSSIIFGTLAALAIGVMLYVLGLGVSMGSVDANTSTPGEAAATVGGVAGIWFLVSTAIALFIGGFLASGIAHTFTGSRATVYGLGVWGLATLISMSVLVPALVKGTGNAINAAGTIADRAGNVLGAAGNTAVQAGQNSSTGLMDRLQRTLIGKTTGDVDPSAAQEITGLITQRITQGEWTPQQREELNSAVARAAKINEDDARRRVDEAQNTINSNIEQAQAKLRQAAEVTRKAVSAAAYYIFGAMIVGLLAAIFGARYGELDENELPAFARLRFAPPRTATRGM